MLAALAALVMSVGCGGKESTESTVASDGPRVVANVTLRIAVVNDVELVAAIAKLRGEWQANSGGELTVEAISLDQASTDDQADLLVFPSRYLGALCEANRLRPIRRSILESKSLDFGDILPLVREKEIVYGQQVMALPLGCPTPLIAATENEHGSAIAPLVGEFAAYALMARVAPLAQHASREALWFDTETMKPRIAEPPFVRALEEIVKASAPISPCEVAAEFVNGRITVAFVWPCRGNTTRDSASFVVTPFPAATEAYNPVAEQWEATPPRHVTLLASSGRLVGVSMKSRNAASAFRLAGWLASAEIVGQLARASNGIAICRSSQGKFADDWLGGSTTNRAFSEQLAVALSRREGVTVPRLPGVDDYLARLADAVRTAADGSPTPEAALAAAGADWEQLTDKLGRDNQRTAYRRCLGIEPISAGTEGR